MDTKKLDAHLDSLSEIERLNLIRATAASVLSLGKRREKALKAELDTHVHASRAKRTTLYANAYKITGRYNQDVELLKYLVNKL